MTQLTPLWARVPRARIVREIPTEEPWVPNGDLRMFYCPYDPDCDDDPDAYPLTVIALEHLEALSVSEARALWRNLGELLAIHRFDPVPTQHTPTIAVTLTDMDGPRNLIRTAPIPAGVDNFGDPMTVHVEVSGDPLPHGPDEMRPTVCVNRMHDDSPDQAFIEIDDADSLDQLIEALIAAGPVLREQRKKAGL